jgi:hypothetical protein
MGTVTISEIILFLRKNQYAVANGEPSKIARATSCFFCIKKGDYAENAFYASADTPLMLKENDSSPIYKEMCDKSRSIMDFSISDASKELCEALLKEFGGWYIANTNEPENAVLYDGDIQGKRVVHLTMNDIRELIGCDFVIDDLPKN